MLIYRSALLLFFIFTSSCVTANFTQEKYYALLKKYDCLPAVQDFEKTAFLAWVHKTTNLETLQKNKAHLPELGLDNQIKTKNKMGSNWGYQPAVAAGVNQYLTENPTAHMLEIGSAYGIDTISLLKNYPHIRITAIDPCQEHCDYLKKLSLTYLTDLERERLTILAGMFPKDFNTDKQLKSNVFDLVTISAVIHFYKDEWIEDFLKKLRPKIKPGGHIIMSNISNHYSPMTKFLSFVVGSWLPYPIGFAWINHVSPPQIERLGKVSGFKSIMNQYVGTTNEKSVNHFPWWTGGLLIKECTTYSVLERPI